MLFGLGSQIIFEDAVNRPYTVFPSNLLPLIVGSSIVGNANLVDAAAKFGYFGSHFRLKAKAVFLDVDLLNDLAAECLVAGFHVREV